MKEMGAREKVRDIARKRMIKAGLIGRYLRIRAIADHLSSHDL
jgi:hypothetical protein